MANMVFFRSFMVFLRSLRFYDLTRAKILFIRFLAYNFLIVLSISNQFSDFLDFSSKLNQINTDLKAG